MGTFIWIIIILFAIEGAIWCTSMPDGLKHSIIPKIEKRIVEYNTLERRIDLLMHIERQRVMNDIR